MSTSTSPLGDPILRLEDERLLRGRGLYVDDVRLPGMLHVAFVRCTQGPGRLTDIDLTAARQSPGVVGVFGPDDIPLLGRSMPVMMPQPGADIRTASPLVGSDVRYAGEAVAVVVADDLYRAADAAAAVRLQLDGVSAVRDVDEALLPDAPRVHPDMESNVAVRLSRSFGDVETAFQAASIVVRQRFRSERAAGAAIEPRGVVAQPGGDGGVSVTIWDSTQAPHSVRRGVAQALNLKPEQVRVITPDVGGGFGPKGRLYPESIVLAALALTLQRPVRWQATRQEDMLATYQGRGLVTEAELAAGADGTILGLRARLLQDCGAYLPAGLVVPQNSAMHMLGPYRVPACDLEMVAVYTHKAPLTPLRGGGREQGIFVIERLLDRLAHDIGEDRIEVRRRNVLQVADFPYDTRLPGRDDNTVVYDSGDYPAYLDQARTMIDYDQVCRDQVKSRSTGCYRGVAVTLFLESTGSGAEGARATLRGDGTIQLAVGSPSNGQSHATTLAQVCASQLDVPVDRVQLVSGDTGVMQQGTGTFGSRMAVMAGNAVAHAAGDLRAKILGAAGDVLEISEQDLEIVDGVVQARGVPDRGLSFAELATHVASMNREKLLQAEHLFEPERANAFSGGAHAAVVEVDVETGSVHVLRYVVIHDCGTVINPMVVDGQIHGGVAHGIGNVLGEMMLYDDDGALITDSFASYAMPIAETIPSIETVHHPVPSPNNPAGIKGAGEGGTIGALATIVGAVENALSPYNVQIVDLPLRSSALARACAVLSSRRGAE